jgi:hypothetical protein
MEQLPPFRSQVLNRQGLVAGMLEERGVGEIIAQATQ